MMTKYFSLFFVLVLLGTACSKDPVDRLHGKWQMQEVEENGIKESVDTIYYNFLTSVYSLQVYNSATDSYPQWYGLKKNDGDDKLMIRIEIPENITTATDSLSYINSFKSWTDWSDYIRDFTIEEVTGSRLVLISEGKKYTFRKF